MTPLMFPDAVEGVQHVLASAGMPDGAPLTFDTDVVRWVPADFYQRIEGEGRVLVAVTSVPGSPSSLEDWERVTRVRVEWSGLGNDAAQGLAEHGHAHLKGDPHDTPAGYLDEVLVVAEPYDAQFAHDLISQFVAVYDVVTRPI